MKDTLEVDLDFDSSVNETPNPPKSEDEILYKVGDEVPFIFSALHALQISICQVLSVVWLPVMLSTHLCILEADPARVYLVSAAFLSTGVATLAQSVIGIRLPIVVTPSVIYTTALSALLSSSSELKCPGLGTLYVAEPGDRTQAWHVRLREVQGALLFAGVLQVVFALSGIQTWIYKIISPAVMACAIILMGLTTDFNITNATLGSWKISSITLMSFILFGLISRNIRVPLPILSPSAGLKIKFFPVFKMFPVLWSLVTVYLLSNAFSRFHISILKQEQASISFEGVVDFSRKFYLILPFEYGGPTLTTNSIIHILPAVLLQSIVSYVTFHGNAHTCCDESIPRSVARRGLIVEGLAVAWGGVWGNGMGSNPAIIGLTHFTGIATPRCTILTSIMFITLSFFPHSVLFFSNIPKSIGLPIDICLCIGLICIGMNIFWKSCTGTAKSTRDTTIFGFSLMLGLGIPRLTDATNISEIVGFLNNDAYYLKPCLRSQVLIGVTVGCLLNAILPGERTKQSFRNNKDGKLYKLPTWEELLCSFLRFFGFCRLD